MDLFITYILLFFILFFVMPFVFLFLKVILWFFMDYCGWTGTTYRNNRSLHNNTDRQGNNIADNTTRDNQYNDIFFIEPNSVEAARIRAQLEKDDKDLPSYEEVMRMTNANTPTTTPATNNNFVPALTASSPSTAVSSTSVNTTDTTLSVPPYSETSIPRPLTPPPYTAQAPASSSVVLPITTPLHLTQTSTS